MKQTKSATSATSTTYHQKQQLVNLIEQSLLIGVTQSWVDVGWNKRLPQRYVCKYIQSSPKLTWKYSSVSLIHRFFLLGSTGNAIGESLHEQRCDIQSKISQGPQAIPTPRSRYHVLGHQANQAFHFLVWLYSCSYHWQHILCTRN